MYWPVSISKVKKTIVFLIFLLSISFASSATVNVIDVTIIENAYQLVTYNPQNPGGGTWFDPNENQSVLILNGTISVKNNHPTEAIHDVRFNITNIGNISALTYSTGSFGVMQLFNLTGDYATLFIPGLGPDQTSNFTYTINGSNIRPPLNFTSNYSDSRILEGLSFGVTDNIENVLDENLYTDTCVHNITVTQNTQSLDIAGQILNFTLNNTFLTGADSSNATILPTNRTLNWNVSGLNCLNHGNLTNISYRIDTPTGVGNSTDYIFMNATIAYRLNTTLSRINLNSIIAAGDLEVSFEKYLQEDLGENNGTWNITPKVTSQSNLSVNLTEVALWVSVRNATGTGFTNPGTRDNDTTSGEQLNITYNPDVLLNATQTPWNDNSATMWLFNYTISSSPIVWMDLSNRLIDDGIQLSNRSVTYGNDELYVKEIYVATGYWLEITKNITRIAESNYTVVIEVRNRGTSPTPTNDAVVVYNFLPVQFNLTSTFNFSNSTWYNTSETNTTLNDPVYNGTMYQYAIVATGNPNNASLAAYGGSYNINNTWNVTYNISGAGEFNFEDLFLTGVDPLNVETFGATQALTTESAYKVISGRGEYLLAGLASIVGILILLL